MAEESLKADLALKLEAVVKVKNGSWLEKRRLRRLRPRLHSAAPFHCRDEFDDFVTAIEIFVEDLGTSYGGGGSGGRCN